MKKAFTLIELLVVIAIIAILAAILFPVFAQAKTAAKKTQELSQVKQIGTSIQLYLSDYDDTYPQGYWYKNNSGSGNDGNGLGGYVQWSGAIEPYVKNLQIFISPGDPTGGLAPTCYVGDNRGFGAPSGQTPQASCAGNQDLQAPRISYTANSLLMPRKRRSSDPMSVTSATAIDKVSGTVLIAPQTHFPACINGSSTASGVAFKTHRPTNAILLPDGPAISATFFQGEAASEVGLGSYRAVNYERAKQDIDACAAGTAAFTGGFSHITYAQPNRWNDGANYVMSDTSAKYRKFAGLFSTSDWIWGTRAYTAGGGVVVDDNNNPVQ